MRALHWLVPHPSEGNFPHEEVGRHNLASVRLRVAPFIQSHIRKPLFLRTEFGDRANLSGLDILVVGKVGADRSKGRFDKWIATLERAGDRGIRRILDYTDDHLSEETTMTSFYRSAMNCVDEIVVPSRFLAEQLRQYSPKPISLIEDAVEYAIQPPKREVNNPNPCLLWFGHAANLDSLVEGLRSIEGHRLFRLHLMTNEAGIQILQRQNIEWSKFVDPRATVWSIEGLARSAAEADYAFIPTKRVNKKKRGVSSNRLITSLTLGLPVLSGEVDSYMPYRRYFLNIDAKPLGTFDIDHTQEIQRVVSAQTEVCPHFSFHEIGAKWTSLLAGTDQTLIRFVK